MVRLRPELFLRFIILTAAVSVLWIAWVTIRHQRGKEEAFSQSMRQTFTKRIEDRNLLHFSPELDSISVYPLEADLGFYLFWSPWSDKSINLLTTLDELARSENNRDVSIIALSVKESHANTLLKIGQIEPTLQSEIVWIDGTSIYGELVVPGIPTLIIYNQADSSVTSFVGVTQEEIEQWRLSHP